MQIIDNNNSFNGIFKIKKQSSKIYGEEIFRIPIDNQERELFNFIVKNLEVGMDAYVAGGWVRDKILGKPSKDIDIAVYSKKDTLNAANRLYKKLSNKDLNIINDLNTSTLTLFGISIDLTPFRKETYSPFSSKPTITPGDLETEVTRRDICFNSLLFNIKTNMIIDYTEKGISDLKNGIIDTPLDPKQTFMDDCNRIMRVFRFASTLGFTIAPRVIEAIKSPEILSMLDPTKRSATNKKNTSGEENYNQMFKMMSNSNSENLINTLYSMAESGVLYKILGINEENYLPYNTPQKNKHHMDDSIFDHIMRVLGSLEPFLKDKSKEDIFVLRMSALFHDLGKFNKAIREPVEPHKATDKHQYRYHGHAMDSYGLVRESFKRHLRGDSDIENRIANLVRFHDVLMDKKNIKNYDVYKIYKLSTGNGRYLNDFDNLICLLKADRKGHMEPVTYEEINELERKKNLIEEHLNSNFKHLINGEEIREMIKPEHVREIGGVLNELIKTYLNGELKISPKQFVFNYLSNPNRKWLKDELIPPKPKVNGNWIIEHINPLDKKIIGKLLPIGLELEKQGLSEEEIEIQLKNYMLGKSNDNF